MEETPKGEIQTPESPKNDAPTSIPVTDTASQAEIEQLRKENEQIRMRANQLENEKNAKLKEEQEAQRKQLEENNEFKSLYEREKAEREALAQERQAEKDAGIVAQAKSEVFAKYPKEVTEIAETAGLTLSDDSEASRKILAEKLDAIAEKVKPAKVSGTGGQYTPPAGTPDKDEVMTKMRIGEGQVKKEAEKEFLSGLKSLDKMREMAGLRRDQ